MSDQEADQSAVPIDSNEPIEPAQAEQNKPKRFVIIDDYVDCGTEDAGNEMVERIGGAIDTMLCDGESQDGYVYVEALSPIELYGFCKKFIAVLSAVK